MLVGSFRCWRSVTAGAHVRVPLRLILPVGVALGGVAFPPVRQRLGSKQPTSVQRPRALRDPRSRIQTRANSSCMRSQVPIELEGCSFFGQCPACEPGDPIKRKARSTAAGPGLGWRTHVLDDARLIPPAADDLLHPWGARITSAGSEPGDPSVQPIVSRARGRPVSAPLPAPRAYPSWSPQP